ncbi:MAG: DUF523 domain-containing protein [Cellulosilyticaceae bacterium]
MIIVSACLAGEMCRYDGKANKDDSIQKMVEEGLAVTVCPEVLGGLSIPRIPCEQRKIGEGKIQVINKEGKDCTKYFEDGAKKTLYIAKKLGVTHAILKAKSPSCGCGEIYDGTFSGVLIQGDGITTTVLKENGIIVLTEKDL